METAGRTMTVKEILTDICNVLGSIDVPATKIEQIGIPIARSINGIRACIEAIDLAERKEPEKPEDSDIKIFPVEIIPGEEKGESNA